MSQTPDALEALIAALSSLHAVSPPAQKFLAKHTRPVVVQRGKFLLKAGTVCTEAYFIHQGLLRGYVVQNGKEITTWINAENELVSSISGLSSQAPSFENIQALEDSYLLSLRFDDLEKLYALHPDFNICIRKLLQKYYGDADSRAILARLSNAVNKYERFLQASPQLVNRVPLKYIASYLGIKQETLSRIRNRYAKKV